MVNSGRPDSGLVPCRFGPAVVVAGDCGGLRCELGRSPLCDRDGSGVGSDTSAIGRDYDDRRGRHRVPEQASLPDAGLPARRRPPAAAVGEPRAQHHNTGELFHVVPKATLGALAGGLLGYVAGLPAGGARLRFPTLANRFIKRQCRRAIRSRIQPRRKVDRVLRKDRTSPLLRCSRGDQLQSIGCPQESARIPI